MNRAINHIVVFTLLAVAQANSCTAPSTIVQSQSLSTIFDRTLSTLSYKSSFVDFLSDPSAETLKTYIMSNAKAFIPLWCFGALTLILFIACSVQVCCYNCCHRKSCGTKISKKAYRPDVVRCLVYFFLLLSLSLIALGVTSFILSSDFLKETDYTICSVENTFNELFDGLPAGSSPAWSGVDNFDSYASQIATNFPNVVSSLASTFDSTDYQAIVSIIPNSLYSKAVANYNCPASLASSTVSCPFSNISACFGASNSQIPTFSAFFCQANSNDSAASLILAEQQTNSTLWRESLMNLSSNLIDYNSSLPDLEQLQNEADNLQSTITDYKPSLANGIQTAKDNFQSVEIGLYTVISFIIFLGVCSFVGVYCVYCSKSYGWRYIVYFLWIFYMLLAVISFAASGFLILSTFVAYDSCNTYTQLTVNSTALPSLSYYENSSVTDAIYTCFFPSAGSIDSVFNSASQQTTFQQLNELSNQYYSALPSSSFRSVATTIKDQLNNFKVNPNLVTLLNASTAQNPQAALNAANRYASNGGRPSCQAVNDTFVYNPTDCYPLLLNQPANDPSCILISGSSAGIVADRQSSFAQHRCSALYPTYQNNFNALNTYGEGISSLVSLYQDDPALDEYYNNYFNYYSAVSDFMSNSTRNLFLSFISPYQRLVAGSSCSFLTQSLNTLANQACSHNFPFAYVLTVFIISLACISLILMVTAYLLTVRLEFFEYLRGDLSKYDPNASSSEVIEIEMASLSNRQELLQKQSPQQRQLEQSPSTPEAKMIQPSDGGKSHSSNRYERYDRYDYGYEDRYARSDPRYRYKRYEPVYQGRQPSAGRSGSPNKR